VIAAPGRFGATRITSVSALKTTSGSACTVNDWSSFIG
jgi:hypothetical protein